LNFGSFIHKVLEEGYQEKSLANLKKIARNLMETYNIKESMLGKAEKCFKNFLEWNEDLTDTVDVELEFSIDLAKDIAYTGIIDRVVKGTDESFLVVDYKTGKREKKRLDLYNDKQLQGYAFAISELFNVPIHKITCAHYYPVTGNFVPIKFNKAQIETFKREKIKEIWRVRKMCKPDFTPQLNPFCQWCGYHKVCPKKTPPSLAFQRLDEAKRIVKQERKDKKE
jgi:RecB family exonuclease